jgi:hypothetical protein
VLSVRLSFSSVVCVYLPFSLQVDIEGIDLYKDNVILQSRRNSIEDA